MEPATAMGTFLRVWRSEWARLSRAQLANAVQRHLKGHRRVTSGVVRWWEAGQLPANSEELGALCLVMQAHGLTAAEATQFRRLVFAACVDRHFAGMVPTRDGVHDDAIVEVAGELLDEATSLGAPPRTLDAVVLLCELQPGVAGRLHPAEPGTRARSQEVAFALLQQMLAICHNTAVRHDLARDAFRMNSGFLQQRLGSTLSATVSVPRNRMAWLYNTSFLTNPDTTVPQMLELTDDAMDQGETGLAALGLRWLLDIATFPEAKSLRARMLPLPERAIELLTDEASGEWGRFVYYQQGQMALLDGRFDEAERNWEQIDHWRHGAGWWRLCWHNYAGRFAMARGDWSEASGYLQTAADLARATGNAFVGTAERLIRECERGGTGVC